MAWGKKAAPVPDNQEASDAPGPEIAGETPNDQAGEVYTAEDLRQKEVFAGADGGITRFRVQVRELPVMREAKGFRIPPQTPPLAVMEAIVQSGVKLPSVIINLDEGCPVEVLLEEDVNGRLCTRWGDGVPEAKLRFMECIGNVTSFIAAAAVKANAWFVARSYESFSAIEAGIEELARTQPAVLAKVVILFIGDFSNTFRQIELFRTVTDGGGISFPAKSLLSGLPYSLPPDPVESICAGPSPWSTHMVVFEETATAMAFTSYVLTSFAFARVRLDPELTILHFHSDVALTTRRGGMVLNFVNTSCGSLNLAGLMFEHIAKRNPMDIPQQLRELEEEAKRDLPTMRSAFLSEEGKAAAYGAFFTSPELAGRPALVQLSLVFFAGVVMRNPVYLADKDFAERYRTEATQSLEGELGQKVVESLKLAARPLPDNFDCRSIVTIDVRRATGETVMMGMVRQMTSFAQSGDFSEIGAKDSEERTLALAWRSHDSLLREASRWTSMAFGMQLMVLVCTLAATSSATAYTIFDRGSETERLRWASSVFPVIVTALLSMQTLYKPMFKWGLCLQSAARLRSLIYAYRTRTGEYSKEACAAAGDNPRSLLADAIGKIMSSVVRSEFAEQVPIDKEDDHSAPLLGCCGAPAQSTRLSLSLQHDDDNGKTQLDAEQYLKWRAEPLEVELRARCSKLARQLSLYRACVILATVSSTALGVLKATEYIPIFVAIGAAVQSWIDFQSLPIRVGALNRALEAMRTTILWHQALDLLQQALPENFHHLIRVVEAAAASEYNSFVASPSARAPPQAAKGKEDKASGDNGEGKAEGTGGKGDASRT